MGIGSERSGTDRPPSSPIRDCRDLSRSARLLRGFLREQTEPDYFYTLLAEDTCDLLEEVVDFESALVADIGGGPGYFCEAAARRGAFAVTVDRSFDELHLHGRKPRNAVVGDATALPLANDAFDLVHTSNVLEHVPDPGELLDEALRITRPGGALFVAFTVWLSPWGGHETSPWHLLGGERAVKIYERRHKRPPKNRYLESLFPVYISDFERLLEARPEAQVVTAFPRYYPRWADFLARLPVLREFATWNFAAILRKS